MDFRVLSNSYTATMRHVGGVLSPLDLSHCFCQAGIEMEEGTIEALVLGLGCDTAGKVDATEVLQAVSYFIYLVFAYL